MPTRTLKSQVTFAKPFHLHSVNIPLPAGTYQVLTDEEQLDGLSFEAWRRLQTLLITPAVGVHNGTEQVFVIDPHELEKALAADLSAS